MLLLFGLALFSVGSVGGLVLSQSTLMRPETPARGVGLMATVDARVSSAGNLAVQLAPVASPEVDAMSIDGSPDASPSSLDEGQQRELFKKYFQAEALYNQQLAWFYDDLLKIEAQRQLESSSGSFDNNVNDDSNDDDDDDDDDVVEDDDDD